MAHVEPFSAAVISYLGPVIGEAFSHRQLGEVIERARAVPVPEGPRWSRARDSMTFTQQRDGAGNGVLQLIKTALDPANFIGRREAHEALRRAVNEGLAMAGFHIRENGDVQGVARARTLDEAEARADDLRAELRRRGVLGEVLRFCRAELLVGDYFHAVLEAAKSVSQVIRDLTALEHDGVRLVQVAFGIGAEPPYLAITSLSTESERNEQKGFASLCQGVVQLYRNPTAHDPRISRPVDRAEALDMLTLASYIHRRLGSAQIIRRAS